MSAGTDGHSQDQMSSESDAGSAPPIARLTEEAQQTSLLGIITARPVFDATGDVVDFEYLSANRVLRETHGIEPEDLVGNTMLGMFPDLAGHYTFPYYCDVARTGEPLSFESDFKSDELDIHVIVSVSKPDPDYITITFVEVSEIVRVTDALAELNMLSGTQIGLDAYIDGVMDIGLRAFNAKQGFQLALHENGYAVSARTGRGDGAVGGKPLPDEVVLDMRQAGSVKAVRDVRNHCAEAGSRFPFRSFIGASYMMDDQTVGALVFCMKAARRREPTPSEMKLVWTLAEAVGARVRLDVVNRALKQRNEDLARFASLVSHDLKAPLRTIRLLSEMLSGYVVDDPQADTILNEIQGNANQAQSMIKSLRDFAQLGVAGLHVEAVDVSKIIQGCVDRLAGDVTEAGAKIDISVTGRVLADETLLIQVFSNLILNALKYTGRSDPEIRIESHEGPDEALTVCVTDNGAGVDLRYAERIFELFRRVPGSEKKSEGEGVGLAVCRKIVESLGGKIWLDTEFTSGARFCLMLLKAD